MKNRKSIQQSSRPELKIKMSPFTLKVIAMIKKIPRGKVATYGQIARLAGKPHGSRGVGWILNSMTEGHKLPWQRVLNSQGKISFPPKTAEHRNQKRLLEKEGVLFLDRSALDLKKYQWKKEPRIRRKPGEPSMFR